MSAEDMLDAALDAADEVEEYDLFDLYKDDGWTNADIRDRRHRVDGEYLGPKE